MNALIPMMTPGEIGLLKAVLFKRKHLVEFGCGGSTMVALESEVAKIDSIDSDKNWIDRLSAQDDMSDLIEKGIVRFHHVDIGEIGAWGKPKDESAKAQWRRYWSILGGGIAIDTVDVVLVDGRFRAACAINAALTANPTTPIIIHDYWSRGRKYKIIEKYLFNVARVDSMGVFLPKHSIDETEARKDLNKKANDYS